MLFAPEFPTAPTRRRRPVRGGVAGAGSLLTTTKLGETLPEWTEDSFAGHPAERRRRPDREPARPRRRELHRRRRLRLVAGRGRRSASASSRPGTSDMVLVGGVDAIQNPFALPLLQQDAGALARRALPAVRRRGRRHRDQRGRRRRSC